MLLHAMLHAMLWPTHVVCLAHEERMSPPVPPVLPAPILICVCCCCCWCCLHYRDKLRLLQQRDAALAAYWDMGCSYGKPTPLVLQPLAELLCGRLDNGLLWCVEVCVCACRCVCVRVVDP